MFSTRIAKTLWLKASIVGVQLLVIGGSHYKKETLTLPAMSVQNKSQPKVSFS